ncbi:kinase-like domain-containing protein [Rhodocollybia butyracea]|uniref:non-specific serine/threonine protein kinase n=1 Tax=Rhodocollybia butyracea TaxID=206335 RepID=A0A9P5PKK3_9AGAR|nr:kinase-like domain-containing protein [Rhodocollybia butyracea]
MHMGESIHGYRPGGYHPVHIGDKFHNGRYTVVNKFGNGVYAVVWLVYDSETRRHAALKICVANREGSESRVSDETAVAQYLQQVRNQQPDGDDEGSNHVIQIFDVFTHQGPNGTHLCIVTEIVGPNLADALSEMYIDNSPPTGIAKRIAAQIAYGLRYLHKHGIVHGDLHIGNVLLYCPTVISSFEDIENEKIRKPCLYDPYRWAGLEPPSELSDHVPQYFVRPCLAEEYIKECFANPASLHIKLCDFGESFLVVPPSSDSQSKPSPNQKQFERTRIRPSHCPVEYRSPELLFENLHSPASDVWALANLINFLLLRQYLFYNSELSRAHMVLKLGKFPQRWWAIWSARIKGPTSSSGSINVSGERWDWFDENEKWCSKRLFSRNDCEVEGSDCGNWLNLRWLWLPGIEGEAEEERAMVEKILRKMTVYDIEQRATAAEVVELIPDNWMREDPREAIRWPRDDDSDEE